jgi:glycosyltransferase involved in cell wall biosynthesis
MRVAVIATSTVDGGAEAYLRRLYGGLRPRGIEGHLIGDLPGWDETGLTATSLGYRQKWSRSSSLRDVVRVPLDVRRARAAVARGSFDLVHMQFKREQITLSRPLSVLAPVVWSEHGRLPRGAAGWGVARAYRQAAASAAAIVCVSDAVRRDVQPLCRGLPTRIVEIPNSVDTARFRPPTGMEKVAARRRFGVDEPVVAVIGRLHKGKRVDLAIDAVRERPELSLLVAGDGPEREGLEPRAEGSRVVFAGHVPDVREALFASNVCLFPTAGGGEGLPLAMLEAAACGVPIVSVAGSGVEEITLAAGGEVGDPSPSSIAAAIDRAIGSPRSELARRWAEAHEVTRWLAAHADLFEELVATRERRG